MVSSSSPFTAEELSIIRAETPGLNQVVHFNNAGAALMPAKVAQKVMDYINHELLYGGYETAEHFAEDISGVYNSVAQFLGCDSQEIAITENATVAWGQAFQSINFNSSDIILTSHSEYASNYIAFLQLQKRLGVSIEAIPNDEFGAVDVQALEKMINPRVKLIAITHLPTNGGLVNPAADIGQVASRHNVYYLLDACQSAGQMPLNVKEIGCDFLSATSRKFIRGPRGVGFLYVNAKRLPELEPPLLDLHGATWSSTNQYTMRDDARRFENWESNLAGVVGLSEAVRYALDLGLNRIWERIQKLGSYLRTALDEITGVQTHDLGKIKSGIVSFGGPFDPFKMKRKLFNAGFNVSIISADGTLLDMNARNLSYLIRASVHYYNTKDEIDRFSNFIRNNVD